jgi:hypothetical protein
VTRSTFDQDLLVIDRRVLTPAFWHALAPEVTADVRTGDADDPLAGVVRLSAAAERDVDVVVGRTGWQAAILERAVVVGAGPLMVVEAADLVLLKLYAGGTQDRWDIDQLLAITGDTVRAAVDARVHVLPPDAQTLWRQFTAKQ